MLYDSHVHVAELHRCEATDRFVFQRRSIYMRMLLRQLRIRANALAGAQANDLVRQRLLDWACRSSIDRFVLLAMDGVYDREGRWDARQTRWRVENSFVAGLAQFHPAFLFGASIHPYRKDALDELRQVIARGACLIKWIPSAQWVRLDDALCTPFYDLLAQSGVPLLVYTGHEHTTSGGLNDWNDPALLRHPLSRGVKVIAAHCGTRLFLHEPSFFMTFCRMAREHEHLYGDLAAFGIPTRIGALRQLQKDRALLAKVVYGSDFPTVTMARWFIFSIGRRAVREILHEANPLERPYLLMRRMEVPDEVFRRAGNLLRLAPTERGDA